MTTNQIFDELKKLRENSYSKYSHYAVACIIIDVNNNIYKGVNVENAVYPLTICAERSAIVSGVSNGMKQINEVHLLCSNEKSFGVPCGACRQTINEFMNPENFIYLYNNEGEVKKYQLKELLPLAFNDNFLKGE